MKKAILSSLLACSMIAGTVFSTGVTMGPVKETVTASAYSYPMDYTITYKTDSGTTLGTKTGSCDATDPSVVSVTSPTYDGYALKNDSDAVVTGSMINWSFPASNYVRKGTGSYTVVYCPLYTYTILYWHATSHRPIATSRVVTGKEGSNYYCTSPVVEGYTPDKAVVSGKMPKGGSIEQVLYYENTYTISYNANGGSGAPASQTKGYVNSIYLSSTEPTRSNYSFIGWSTSSTATSATYQAGDKFTTNANTTLYAVWKPDTYTVSYDANGGSGAPSDQTKTYGQALTLSSTKPTRSGYTFKGWATYSSATSATYSAGDSYTSNSGCTLYAVWEKELSKYTIRYDAMGGSGAPASQTKTEGSTLTLSSTEPTRTGYTFLGWSTSSSATTVNYQPGGKYTSNVGTTLYAVWEADTYTISYNANGGSGAPGNQTKTYGVSLKLSSSVPYRTSYKFLGWSTNSKATTATYQPGATFTANGTTTLYAVWEYINYDLSVSDLEVTPDPVNQFETVGVKFRIDSWDKNNAYNNIPVSVYLNANSVYTTTIDIAAYGVQYVSFNMSVGALEGVQTLEARVNWADHSAETDSSNNKVSTTFTVNKLIELSAESIKANADYVEGNTVITSFYAKNESTSDILPQDHMAFTFEVYEMNGSVENFVLKQTWNDVVIPANGKNLVYFKWQVPANNAGKTYICKGTVNSTGTVKERYSDNNTVFFTFTSKSATTSQTPNTRYEEKAPSTYNVNAKAPTTSTGSASWSMWVYENNALVLKTYGIKVTSGNPVVNPDPDCKSATYENSKWNMGAGYGYTISWNPSIVTLSGTSSPNTSSYTTAQNVFVLLPEYNYSKEVGKYETLESSGNTFMFRHNSDADGNARIHFIPVYVKDSGYTVSVTATEIWTPAGMITSVRNANTVAIKGSIYDDWYH